MRERKIVIKKMRNLLKRAAPAIFKQKRKSAYYNNDFHIKCIVQKSLFFSFIRVKKTLQPENLFNSPPDEM